MSRLTPRALSPTAAYALVAAVIGLALFASATPSPLYEVYRAEWGFSPFVLTLVYAVYAFGVLAALLLVGRISDEVGRRPVLVAALTALLAATALFLVADSLAWLFAARALQGLATGTALGAASAALLDLHPRRDSHSAGLVNGVVSATGMGTGALISSLLVEYGPIPQKLPYLVLMTVFGVLLVGALLMHEPVSERQPLRIRPQRPYVPPAIRGAFLLAGLGVLASWSIGGLYLSLGPELAGELLQTHSAVAGGIAALCLAVPGGLAQIAFQHVVPWRLTTYGALTLAAGMGLIVASLSFDSAVFFLVATAITGMGFGAAFLGGLRSLTAVLPERHRAEVMSAFYVVAYASISIPAVAAGIVVSSWGLLPTFRVFGILVIGVALVVSVGAARTRPRRQSGDAEPLRSCPKAGATVGVETR